MYIYFSLIENIILCLTVTGKANGAPPVKLVLVGSIPTPKFFSAMIKNFEGGAYVSIGMEKICPQFGGINHA
jgi:hypothetical protein